MRIRINTEVPHVKTAFKTGVNRCNFISANKNTQMGTDLTIMDNLRKYLRLGIVRSKNTEFMYMNEHALSLASLHWKKLVSIVARCFSLILKHINT